MVIEDDPVLGKALAYYPSNRARLLIIDAVILGILWFIITIALLNVEAGLAAVITMAIIGLATVILGWYTAHLWNREVILYERGFSYREGSHTAYLLYAEMQTLRLRAERLSYFGGLVRRTVHQYVVTTGVDETIQLTNLYKRIEELGTRLEELARPFLRARLESALANHERVVFSETLQMDDQGLYESGRSLAWVDFGGYQIEDGHLRLLASTEVWFSLPLADVYNITLLLGYLRQRSEPS